MKYLFAFLPLLLSCSPTIDESAAIRQLLEKESATWRAQDFKGHAACWHIQPHSKILISTPNGMFDVPPAVMLDPATKMGDGGSAVNSNYLMDIHDGRAWVSHDEVSTAKDGVKSYSKEIRFLEKIAGNWKIVGQSIHSYTPQ